jgi:hypothetical protein
MGTDVGTKCKAATVGRAGAEVNGIVRAITALPVGFSVGARPLAFAPGSREDGWAVRYEMDGIWSASANRPDSIGTARWGDHAPGS